MSQSPLSGKQLTTDRVVAIVFIALGVLFEIVWLVPSLMTIMITDSGTTPGREVGIYLMIFGPIVAVVALTVTTIVLLALKRRAMLTGIFTLVGPVLIVVLGALIAFAGEWV